MATEMIARLALNAEDFSRGVQSATAGLGPAMEKAGRDAATKFDAALAPGLVATERRISRTLEQGLKLSGGDALKLDIEGLRSGAQASAQRAQAALQLAAAMDAVNRSTQNVTKAQQLELVAAQSVAQKYTEKAQAAQAEVVALEAVQRELDRTAQAGQRTAEAQRSGAVSAGQMRAGMQQLSYQIGDVATSLSTLPLTMKSVATVFGQQAGQVVQAVSMMQGGAKGFIGFMAGPWGAVLTGAVTVLGMLASASLDSSDAQKEQEKAANDLQNALKALDQAARQNVETEFSVKAAAYASAQAFRDQSREARELTIAKLKLAQADLQSRLASSRGPGTIGSDLQAMGAARVADDIGRLDSQIARQTTELQAFEVKVKQTELALVQRGVAVATDAAAKATWRYDVALARLNARFDQVSKRDYAAELAKITQTRDTSLDAIRQSAANDNKGRGKTGAESGAADRKEERAAEQLRREDERRLQALKDIIQQEQDDVRLAGIRTEQGDLAADLAEARLKMEREFPHYANKTAEEIARQLGISQEKAKIDKAAYALAVGLREEKIRTADAEREILDFLDQQNKQAQAIFTEISKERAAQRREVEEMIDELSYYLEDAFSGNFKNIWKQFENQGIQALANVAAQKTVSLLGGNARDVLQTIVGGASLGAGAASMTGGSGLGGSIGGAVGGAISKEVLGQALGTFAGPFGSVVGGVLGGALGGLLKKTTYGTAKLTGNDASDVSVTGNNSGARSGASGAARTVQEGLAQIADALGASVGDYLVSIGKYDDEWRVSTTGYAGKLNFKGDTSASGKGLHGFYDDEAGAIAFAIQDALSDGAIRGISAAAERILKSGQDLQAAIEKAVSIESIPKLLKQRLDPLGAALDEVDAKYKKLAATLKEGGASLDQIAEAQKLWQLERADTIKSVGSLSDGLKSFLSSLKAGDSSPLSLREQQANALAALAPYRAAIEAGQAIDTNAFQEVAQTFLSVERQINGSTQGYFSQYGMITGLLEKQIALIDAQASGADAAADPFSEMIAQSTQASANILEQQTTVLTDMRTLLEKLTSGSINWSEYITATRGMAA